MGLFAELDDANKVLRVMFSEQPVDAAWFTKQHGGRWVEASSYTKTPTHGATYDVEAGVFRPAPPAACWVWDEDAWEWKIPVPHPDPENMFAYRWDDETASWLPQPADQQPAAQS